MTRFRPRVIEYNDKLVLRRKAVNQKTRTGTYIANTREEVLFKSTGCIVNGTTLVFTIILGKLGRQKVQKIVFFFCKSGSYPLLFTLLNGFSLGHTTTAYVTCLRPNAFQALRILLFRFFSAFVLNIKFWQFLSRFFVVT